MGPNVDERIVTAVAEECNDGMNREEWSLQIGRCQDVKKVARAYVRGFTCIHKHTHAYRVHTTVSLKEPCRLSCVLTGFFAGFEHTACFCQIFMFASR